MKFDRKKADEIAQGLLGKQFRMGARGENNEIDCYGVLVEFYKAFGLSLPDYSVEEDWDMREEFYLKEYANFFRKLGPDEKPEIGDAVLFLNTEDTPNHSGVVLSEDRFIHSRQGAGTRIDKFSNPYWKDRVYGFFRVKEEGQ